MAGEVGWHRGRLVAFDLETTGPEPEEARIVSAAVLFLGGGEPTDSRRWIVDPGVEIPAEAAAIHGITTEIARASGKPAAAAVAEILAALRLEPDLPIVAFNATYDLTVLDREARRYDYVPLEPGYVVDPFVIDKALDKYRKGSRKLRAVASFYGVELSEEEAHAADADAITTARLAYRLGVRTSVGSMALEDLHAAQVRWRRADVEDLMAYDRRRGKPPRDYRPDWPVVPFREPA